jgi:hypothetical protein
MIGFDSIGQAAIGELTGENDTIIFVPAAAAVTVTTAAPLVSGGGSVLPAAAAVTVTTASPAIRSGVLVTAPAAPVVAVTAPAASVQISATVTAPAAPVVTATATAPLIGAGAYIAAPVARAVTVTVSAPVVTAGKSVFPPAAVVSVTAPIAGVSISATISPATCQVVATSTPAEILGGNYIEASNTITMSTPYGEIGSSSIGEFSIGEGEPSSRIVRRGPLVIISCTPPFVTTGKAIFPSAAVVSVTAPRPEIDGRTRKLRILAIAS